jgi:rRNA-processing protein FCF1
MIKVILDTNFLIYCVENKVDYAAGIMEIMTEGYELVVPEQVIAELKDISMNSKKLSDRSAAFLALKLLEHNKVKIISAEGRIADEAILNLVRMGSIIATLDLELRKKLKSSRIIVIKGHKKVAFE